MAEEIAAASEAQYASANDRRCDSSPPPRRRRRRARGGSHRGDSNHETSPQEYGAEANPVDGGGARAHDRRADERVEAALSMLSAEAERRATRGGAPSSGKRRRRETRANSRRARARLLLARRSDVETKGVGGDGKDGGEGMAGDGRRFVARFRRPPSRSSPRSFSSSASRCGAARRGPRRPSDAALLRSQLALARRETEAAEAEAERSARRGRAVGVALKWACSPPARFVDGINRRGTPSTTSRTRSRRRRCVFARRRANATPPTRRFARRNTNSVARRARSTRFARNTTRRCVSCRRRRVFGWKSRTWFAPTGNAEGT